MDIKEINKRIKSIKTRGKNIDRDIDIAGCAIMEHAAEHGDYSAANRLVDALPKSARTKAFITWFSDHTPYNWTEKEKCFKLPKDAIKRRQFMIDEAKAVPFWEYTVETEPKSLDIDKVIASLFKRFEKEKKEGREVFNVETLVKIAAALDIK
tara:strand:+ start:178 stop:636 length:459 start_codon:yes stop_codon:yes gene_type:complete